jgi:23S rRNA pseudouridine2605 synthase
VISDPEGMPSTENSAAKSEIKPKAKASKKRAAVSAQAVSVEVTPAENPAPAATAKAKPARKSAAKKATAAPEEVDEPVMAEAEVSVEPDQPAVLKPARKTAKKKVAAEPVPVAEAAIAEPVVAEPEPAEAAEEPVPVPKAKKRAPSKAKVEIESGTATKSETEQAAGPAPKLERLQKILAKAGISSRRKAEELILGGQVQINGKVVLELGTKADPERDHVRVDGKLLQGPERIRYFVLNKPKGYVTTVSDPEGRPTVMEFFAAERERLYPVGRLDYLSEGLLLVTNDGELANKLTKAASGVEKTYLVKVAGQPTEDMLDVLRGGVVIEKGRPGTHQGRVRTAPAKIRQVRQGDNPWYEVIIIEGRNRELRKMFEEIGHHVEKIRRVGYGPLILDLEPGKLRELEPEEVQQLRLAAEGKLKVRRRRGPKEAQLPTVAGKTVRYKKADGKPGFERPSTLPVKRAVRPEFQQESKRSFNPAFRPAPEAPGSISRGPVSKFPTSRPDAQSGPRAGARPAFKSAAPSDFKRDARPPFKSAGRPAFKSASRAPSADFRSPEAGPSGPRRPSPAKPGFTKPGFGKPAARRPEPSVTDYVLPPRKAGAPDFGDEPDFKPEFKPRAPQARPAFRTERPGSKPAFRRDAGGDAPRPAPAARSARPARPVEDDDFTPSKTPGFKIEPVADVPRSPRPRSGDRPFRPRTDGPRTDGPRTDGPGAGARPFRPRADGPPAAGRPRPFAGSPDRARPDRPSSGPTGSARPGSERPSSGRSSSGRPSSGRFGSDRPSSDRPREFRPRADAGAGPARRGDGPPKKFAGTRPSRPAAGGSFRSDSPRSGPPKPSAPRTGPDGEPRKKERWRNSFTGKNKGRPKPKSE